MFLINQTLPDMKTAEAAEIFRNEIYMTFRFWYYQATRNI